MEYDILYIYISYPIWPTKCGPNELFVSNKNRMRYLKTNHKKGEKEGSKSRASKNKNHTSKPTNTYGAGVCCYYKIFYILVRDSNFPLSQPIGFVVRQPKLPIKDVVQAFRKMGCLHLYLLLPSSKSC